MTANENNEKYIAEAWIDDGKEEEFKASFLQNLLQQKEGHKADGSGLNADKLDGMHYNQIHQEILDITENFLSEIRIGKVLFSKGDGGTLSSFIPFECIQLNVDGVDQFYSNTGEDYDNSENLSLPWAESQSTEERIIPNLNDVFYQIYQMIQDRCTTEDFYTVRDKVDTLESFRETLEESGAINEEGKINADSINGIRFYIVSETQYNNLGEDIKNNIKNIFFVKPDSEVLSILDSNGQPKYPTGNIDNIIDTAPINSYYEFRVANFVSTEQNPDVYLKGEENYPAGRYLQYKHEYLNQWRIMCHVNDFLDEGALGTNLIDLIETRENYFINPISLSNSLENLDSDSEANSYIKNHYISGATFTPIGSSEQKVLDYTNEEEGYIKNNEEYNLLNLQPLVNNVNSKIAEVISSVNNLKTKTIGNSNPSTNLLSQIQTNRNNITSIKGGSTKSIATLDNEINNPTSGLSKRVSDLETVNQWKFLSRWTKQAQYDFRIYSNGSICVLWGYLNQTNYYKDIGLEIKTSSNPMFHGFGNPNYRPIYPATALDISGQAMFFYQDGSGNIGARSLMGRSLTNGEFYFHIPYIPKKSIDGLQPLDTLQG